MLKIKMPSNEYEFCQMMEDVDNFLRKEDISPPGRPIRGWMEIARVLKLNLSMFPQSLDEPRLGVYDGDDLTLRIFRWFDERYGDKIKIQQGVGRTIVLIRGDPWEVILPKVYGTVNFFISQTEKSSDQNDDLKQRRIPRSNILDSISGLPEGLSNALNSNELSQIASIFMNDLQAMSLIDDKKGMFMFKEVVTDINASVEHFLSSSVHYGFSMWSSLQATEKALKSFLMSKGIDFPYSHKLSDLANLAENNGLPALLDNSLDKIQCNPSVRYGEIDVSIYKAYGAHKASIAICSIVAGALPEG